MIRNIRPSPAAMQAGVATLDITPKESIWLAGFAARTKPSQGVRQRIFAKALALRDEKGVTAVLVTADKDALQMVGPDIRVLKDVGQGVWMDAVAVEAEITFVSDAGDEIIQSIDGAQER